MPYDQMEANRRFEGLLGLWRRLHERLVGPINSHDEWKALAEEGRHLVIAYNEEMDMYTKKLGHQTAYQPTIDMILEIQEFVFCSSSHIMEAHVRLHNIDAGRATFTEMLGTPPARPKVWN